ncbi:hypothetical protein HAX54_002333, partial [Datura stramonium]|nr:hypothetical protein [Datura stramonium]
LIPDEGNKEKGKCSQRARQENVVAQARVTAQSHKSSVACHPRVPHPRPLEHREEQRGIRGFRPSPKHPRFTGQLRNHDWGNLVSPGYKFNIDDSPYYQALVASHQLPPQRFAT